MSLHGWFVALMVLLSSAGVVSAQGTPGEKLKADAEAAYSKGDFANCLEITTQILAANPKDHAALYLRASSHVELGVVRRDGKELRLGIEDARESLKIGGANEINYYLPYMYGMTALANLEQRSEHVKVVMDVAQSVLAKTNLTPEQRSNVHYQRAAAYIHLRDFDKAVADYEAAIKTFPGHLGAHVGLAESHAIANRPERALAAFTKATETFPTNPLVFNNRGLYQQQRGNLQDAVADFNKALQLDPKFAVAFTNRAFTQQAAGNFQAAEADYGEAIKLDPNNPLFRSLRGTCRLSGGNPAAAIEDYSESIKLAPKGSSALPVNYADLGFARYFAKDYAGAVAAFDQAVSLNAQMRYLNPWRAWSLVMSNKVDVANTIVDLSVKKGDTERDWVDQMVLFIGGKISEQELVNVVSKVTDTNLKNAQLCEAFYFIAERRAQAGDKEKAAAFYQQVIQTKAAQLSAYRGAQYALKSFGGAK